MAVGTGALDSTGLARKSLPDRLMIAASHNTRFSFAVRAKVTPATIEDQTVL
jgi:hypothetical protein